MSGRPRFADDWPGLAAVAERLRDDRARRDPEYVAAGQLTAQQAAGRARVSQALALQWRAVVRGEPIPQLDALPGEIRADLKNAAAGASKRAADAPNVAVQLGAAQVRYALFAEGIEALLWQQRPYRDGTDCPHIVFVHGVNLLARAQQAERPAPPARKPVAPTPPAPPLRQSSFL